MTKAGDKFILWREKYSLNAYRDQFDKSHKGYIVLEEFIVTVIETKNVKGMWRSDTYQGLKATTEDGKPFTCNWNSFPDDSMTPTYYWDVLEDENDIWQPVDAIQALNHGYIHVDKTGNQKIPFGVSVCNKHKVFYDITCWKCHYEKRYKKELK